MGTSQSTLNPESRTSASAAFLPSLRFVSALAARFAIPGFVFLLPLIVWPGLAQPFSSPKLAAWYVVTLLGAAACAANLRQQMTQTSGAAVIGLSFLAACVGISAGVGATADFVSLALVFTGLAWFVVLRSADRERAPITAAIVSSASVISIVALLQFANLDLFQMAGWAAVGGANSRMRIYATLGNPNFVGAFLAGALPLTIAFARDARNRWWFAAAAVLQTMAIAATGSRAAALGAALGGAIVLMAGASRRKWPWLALALAAALAVIGYSPARGLSETLQGRLYVWRVSAPQITSLPVFGYGPGAFENRFAAWQQAHFASPANASDLRFAARFDHAHSDPLEWTIEYGWAGLTALVFCGALFGVAAWRAARNSSLAHGALAGVCALAVISVVDFPLHRPAELFLCATLMALSLATAPIRNSGTASTAEP